MGETRRKRAISSFFADFGIVTKPFCNDQRKRTCAGERRTSRAMVVRPGSPSFTPLVSGLYSRRPRSDAHCRRRRHHVAGTRVKFDLIHRPRNLRVAQELFEMVHHEIANADRATAALAQDTLERAPGVPSAMRYGPMEKEKIDRYNRADDGLHRRRAMPRHSRDRFRAAYQDCAATITPNR